MGAILKMRCELCDVKPLRIIFPSLEQCPQNFITEILDILVDFRDNRVAGTHPLCWQYFICNRKPLPYFDKIELEHSRNIIK